MGTIGACAAMGGAVGRAGGGGEAGAGGPRSLKSNGSGIDGGLGGGGALGAFAMGEEIGALIWPAPIDGPGALKISAKASAGMTDRSGLASTRGGGALRSAGGAVVKGSAARSTGAGIGGALGSVGMAAAESGGGAGGRDIRRGRLSPISVDNRLFNESSAPIIGCAALARGAGIGG